MKKILSLLTVLFTAAIVKAAIVNPVWIDGTPVSSYDRVTDAFVTNELAFYEADEVATIGIKFSADDDLFVWLQENPNHLLGLHAWLSDEEDSPYYSLKVGNRPIPSAFTYVGDNTYIVSFVMKDLFGGSFPQAALTVGGNATYPNDGITVENGVLTMNFMLFGYDLYSYPAIYWELPSDVLTFKTKPYTGTKTYSGNFSFGVWSKEEDDDNGNGNGNNGGDDDNNNTSCLKNISTKLWMHYMPWFADKETDGYWGGHWNSNGRNPEIVDNTGKRQIPSHFYPLIGTYSTSDTIALEYHFLLMKYAGIDGILIDWYGIRNVNDYPQIKSSTEVIINVLAKVGLEYAIVYEDWTAAANGASQSSMIQYTKNDLLYCENKFFSQNNYIKINGRPLFLTFGPRNLTEPWMWTEVFSVLKQKPFFMPLVWHRDRCDDYNNHNVDGEYQWTDLSDDDYNNSFYYVSWNYTHYIASAHPGFKDYYGAGGASTYPVAEHRDGDFLKKRLQLVNSYNPPYLQLATWNDYGEGTMFEPTREFGYKFLNLVQQYAGVPCYADVLPNIYEYYNLRKKYKDNEIAKNKLKQAFDYFVLSEPDAAVNVLNSLDIETSVANVTNDDFFVTSVDGIIYISNLSVGKTLAVYDVLGRMIYQTKATKSEEIISHLNVGVYIVSIDGYQQKVLITK